MEIQQNVAAKTQAGRHNFTVKIGIETENATVGNVGPPNRLEFSAIGDAVNLAARLEGASGRCGAELLVGPNTADAVIAASGPKLLRLIQRQVKGRKSVNVVYMPFGAAASDVTEALDLMRVINEQFLEATVNGVRQMIWHLRNDGYLVNKKSIRRVMRLMGLMPNYQKPNTSRPTKGHNIYPYLLRGLRVDRPNQVGAPTSPTCPYGAGSCISWR
jgi:hypothetical protein